MSQKKVERLETEGKRARAPGGEEREGFRMSVLVGVETGLVIGIVTRMEWELK